MLTYKEYKNLDESFLSAIKNKIKNRNDDKDHMNKATKENPGEHALHSILNPSLEKVRSRALENPKITRKHLQHVAGTDPEDKANPNVQQSTYQDKTKNQSPHRYL